MPPAIATIETEQDLREGVIYLCKCEPLFQKVLDKTGLPPLRRKEPGLEGLIQIINGQLISLQAAAAIWQRIEEKFAPFDAKTMAAMDDNDYATCGLSKPKIRTIRAVLSRINDGKLSLTNIEIAENSEIFNSLTNIKGIGPWTAHLYLLTNLGRTDIWPTGDLALRESVKLLFELEKRPSETEMLKLAKPWQPWRAVAARLLWSHYAFVRHHGGTL